MNGTVGIIANPASGNDIRRLVAYGAGGDNQKKINIIRRVLISLAHMEIPRVTFMPDYYSIVPKAVGGMHAEHRELVAGMRIEQLDMRASGTESDSTDAARIMGDMGVDCIVTLGGDGTNRAVAKACGRIPLLPISTGTNNVFPVMVEGTVAGLAAGAYACGRLRGAEAFAVANKRIDVVVNGEVEDIALIDAVIVDGGHIGSRALWDMESVREILVTRCCSDSIGISAVPGQIERVGKDDPHGLLVRLNPAKRTLRAPIAPGLLIPVGVESVCRVDAETLVTVRSPCIVALDGERSLQIRGSDRAAMRLNREGPRVLDIPGILQAAAEQRLLWYGDDAAGSAQKKDIPATEAAEDVRLSL